MIAIAAYATAPPSTSYDFQATDLGDGTPALRGTLTIRIDPSGIVGGWFVRLDGTRQAVQGGLNGAKIWFDIGHFRATGTVREDGRIDGYASTDRGQFSYRADPIRAP